MVTLILCILAFLLGAKIGMKPITDLFKEEIPPEKEEISPEKEDEYW